MRQATNTETGIIKLDSSSGSGSQWVAYAIDPRAIAYFDLYGLVTPNEFMRYIQQLNTPRNVRQWYSMLPTKQLNDPTICGIDVLNVFYAISFRENHLIKQ